MVLFLFFSYILILQVKPPSSDNFVDEVRNPYDVQCRGFIIATPVFSYLAPDTFFENFVKTSFVVNELTSFETNTKRIRDKNA